MVIWLIGMSASGKTTIGKKLFEKLEQTDEKWIFLDGDTFRHILGEDLGHSIEDRKKNAFRISRFCEYLSSQGISVLACVLSIFHDNQYYNKNNIKNYKEVFIDVDFENLIKRDNKNLYQKALDGQLKNFVGVDIKFKAPYSPDLVIDNNMDNPNYALMIQKIIDKFNITINNKYSYTKNNLLKIAHKYQYSKFEGVEFFNKFKIDRKNSIEFFEKRFKKLKKFNLTPLKNKEIYINNDLILKEFLVHLLLSSEDELQNNFKTIDIIVKRFEVGKKLYLTYNKKDIIKNSSNYEELLNYPLFSLVLQRYYYITFSAKKLTYLNAILKVNDIISSINSEFIFIDEIYYSKLALNGELKIVGKIL